LSNIRLFIRELCYSRYSYHTLDGNNLSNYKEYNKESSLLYKNDDSDNDTSSASASSGNNANDSSSNNVNANANVSSSDNSSNNTSSSDNSIVRGSDNLYFSNNTVDRALSEDEINRLRLSRRETSARRRLNSIRRGTGRPRGELTRLRREERIASNLR
jgi:hypothetical protein